MIAYIFPGQGSQKKGMGKDYFDANQDLIDSADTILGYSVRDLCQNDPDHQLDQTQYTQPMLYIVNAMMWLDLKKSLKQKPDYFAGHSLGEYNALLAANAFDFETGLKLVQKRGQLMADAKNGGMAALIGFDENQVRAILEESKLNNIFVANLNSPSQIVISGLRNEIDQSEALFKAAGLKLFIKLKVSGAFQQDSQLCLTCMPYHQIFQSMMKAKKYQIHIREWKSLSMHFKKILMKNVLYHTFNCMNLKH
ncbi:malonyl CoA-acyl carrier protein transacylase [Candidatus Magnetomorum sp. HK-1]|nr:malonyl CoA-acyl carrier protein transacylase [Candidatus Magnetomorum sp. HK-1]